jgi:hypothetical protein
MPDARSERWSPNFRRVLRYLRPHRRPLIIGLIAAVGVSVFYTFSVSSIVPVLKIIFAEHESLVDWLYRCETQRRLGVSLPPDVPDDPRGLLLVSVRESSPARAALQAGDRVAAVADAAGSAYQLMERIAREPGAALAGVRVIGVDGAVRELDLPLLEHGWWWKHTSPPAVRPTTAPTCCWR